MVYDVVFHPDTYRMSDNPKFKKMVEDTALDGIEKQFECKLDRHNIRRPNLKYKGSPVATVIRSRSDDKENVKKEETADVLKDMPYPYSNLTSEELANKANEDMKRKEEEKLTKANKTKSNNEKKEENGFTTPKYSIIHRSDMDIQEYRNAPDARPSTRPKDLVVSIELPLCKSATGVALDIFEDKLSLKSEKPAYKLDIKLPYQVDDEFGSAKFDKTRKLLIVTLPVIPGEELKMPSFIDDKENDKSEEMGMNGNPLIEELPPLEEVDPTAVPDDLPPLEDIDEESQITENTQKSTHMVAYAFPEFDFNQDSETVSLLFHIRNVSEDSVSKSFPEPGMCRIRFASLGSGGFPMHYSFCAKFEEHCELVPEYCTLDISERNMSMLLLKAKDNRYLWNRMMVGLDENSELEEKLFLTETNLQLQLDNLEAESETMGQTAEQTTEQEARVEVTEMNPKKLTIHIEKLPLKFSIPEDDEEYDADECPSSADIEVVHSKETPNLHSILKQRSISESSEDRQSSSSESPTGTSPRELDGQKRGVHFSTHIDKTTYKTNMSVNSMKVTLKSKRRRNRKREEKEKKDKCRKRHNSTGSECSSCDEHDSKQSSEDDHDDLSSQIDEASRKVSENGVIVEDEQEEKVVQKKETDDISEVSVEENVDKVLNKHVFEKPEIDGVQMTKGSKVAQDVKKKLAKKIDSSLADDSDDDVEEGYRTSKVESSEIEIGDENSQKIVDRTSKNAEKEVIESDLIEKSVPTTEGTDSTTDDIKEAADNLPDDSGTNSAMIGQNQGKGEPVNPTSESQDINKLENGMHEKGDSVMNGCESEIKTADETEKESVKESNADVKEKRGKESEKKEVDVDSGVETELSWKEPNRAAPNNEHRSECAFKFTNAMMFDLDVE